MRQEPQTVRQPHLIDVGEAIPLTQESGSLVTDGADIELLRVQLLLKSVYSFFIRYEVMFTRHPVERLDSTYGRLG